MKTEIRARGQQARRRIASRLLPFVFLMYVVYFGDRVNVSFHAHRQDGRTTLALGPSLVRAGVAYLLLPATSHHFLPAMALFILGGGLLYSCYPTLWSRPTLVLSESAAATSFGLINSVGQLGGLVSPYAVAFPAHA